MYPVAGSKRYEILQDDWSRDFVYRRPGTNEAPYDLISLGMDGREGGEGFDADIWNHDAYKKK